MKNSFISRYKKISDYVKAHKIKSAVFLIIILILGYWIYRSTTKTSAEIKYVTSTVQKGTIITTITGSGQVSATNKVDIKAKVSGDITWVNVKAGQTVYAGQALAGIDNKSAKIAVSDAEANLVQSKLQFQKDSATAPIDYQKTIDSLENAKTDLITVFNDTFNKLSVTYLDLPTVITGTENILYGYDLSPNSGQWNVDVLKNMFSSKEKETAKINSFADKAITDYKNARIKYDSALLNYKLLSRLSTNQEIEDGIDESIDATILIAQAVQSELNFLSLITDTAQTYNTKLPTMVTTMQTNARSYLSTVNSDLSSLLSQKKAIDNGNQAIKTAEQNIELLKVGNGTGNNPISLQISQNNLVKQERNLEDLKIALYDYTIVAPFSGTISSVSAKVGDLAGTVATLITKEQVAELSLNEIDATKVSLGQKAILTFDAINDLSLTGTVSEIDPMGTVSQGVVSYNIKITFDTQDPRIKAGMTINASIQTEVHQDVLYVPSSAVKTSNGQSYVLVFTPPLTESTGTNGITSEILPVQIPVQVGISDDTNIEILSGLTEGEQIVSRTINSATVVKTNTPSATSLLGGGGTRAVGR